MRPQPASSRCGVAAWAMRKGPLTLVSTTRRQTAGRTSQNRVGSVMNESLTNFMPRPALFTRMSSRPNRSRVSATTRRASVSWVTSATSAMMRPPPRAAVASTSAPSRAAVATTRAPARARPSAMARPSPRPAPVTIATL